jgi:hypothetical protein
MSYDPEGLLATLNRHDVRYVVLGGLAAVIHGSALPTEDVDVSPERSEANLERLAVALRELGARLRTDREPDGVEFPCDAAFLAAQPTLVNLITDFGDLDLVFAPAGFPGGFDDLVAGAVELDVADGGPTLVAALDDVIAAKRAAGRTKDLASLPHLEALRDELGQG